MLRRYIINRAVWCSPSCLYKAGEGDHMTIKSKILVEEMSKKEAELVYKVLLMKEAK